MFEKRDVAWDGMSRKIPLPSKVSALNFMGLGQYFFSITEHFVDLKDFRMLIRWRGEKMSVQCLQRPIVSEHLCKQMTLNYLRTSVQSHTVYCHNC